MDAHRRRTWWRGAAAALAGVGALALVPAAATPAALPQPVYFFTNTTQPLDAANKLVIRPRSFLMFQDGQWVLQKLRWTGWGTRVARATGISNSSDATPNAAAGKRIKTTAHVTLSRPGRFRGHEVYHCFTLKIPATPKANQHLCIKRTGSLYLLL